MEYDPINQVFLLEDGISVGALFELTPVSCEARSEAFMTALRDQLQAVVMDAIPEAEEAPWILQFYVQDEPRLRPFSQALSRYALKRAGAYRYTHDFLHLLQDHLQQVTQPGGLFFDHTVTGIPWRGQLRRVRATLYRRLDSTGGNRTRAGLTPTEALNEVCLKFSAALETVGVGVRRCGGQALYDWLVPWFNPAPPAAGHDPEQLLQLAPYPGDADLPFGRDLAESVTFSLVRSDLSTHTWWFDDLPHGVVSLQGLRSAPRIGHLSAEQAAGEHIFTLLDRFPAHSILAMTLIFTPQDRIRQHLSQLRHAAAGDHPEAQLTLRSR